MDRSAVFMVPSTWRFPGSVKCSLECGSVTANSFFAPSLLSSSSSVINSPSTFAMLARLISSITRT